MAKSGGTWTRVVTGSIILAVLAVCMWLGPVTRILFFYTMIFYGAREMSDAMRKMGFSTTPWIARALGAAHAALFLLHDSLVFHLAAIVLTVMATVTVGMLKKARVKDLLGSLAICFYPVALYVAFCCLAVQPNEILYPVVGITLFATSFNDAFAYFCGRWFGRHKLCPSISPNKTIEGAVSGTVLGTASGVLTWLILKAFFPTPLYVCLIASFACTLTGQLGDLCASFIKRQAGIKDFSNLLPGHGGIIDRLDSFSFAMPTAFFILYLFHAL